VSNVVIFSVVRDFKMYERCVARNPYCGGCMFYVKDECCLGNLQRFF
jgi:hypothetical protein